MIGGREIDLIAHISDAKTQKQFKKPLRIFMNSWTVQSLLIAQPCYLGQRQLSTFQALPFPHPKNHSLYISPSTKSIHDHMWRLLSSLHLKPSKHQSSNSTKYTTRRSVAARPAQPRVLQSVPWGHASLEVRSGSSRLVRRRCSM